MAGDRTHAQQQRILEGKVNTKNADKDFDADKYLHRSEEGGEDARQPELRLLEGHRARFADDELVVLGPRVDEHLAGAEPLVVTVVRP